MKKDKKQEPQTVVFIGRSGCGKGTQIEKLISYLKDIDSDRKIFHLESGDRFREFINDKYYASKLSRKIYEKGGLQPEFLSVWVWAGKLVENLGKDDHLLVDGTPRKLSEAKVLESAFDFYGRTKVKVVYLNVSKEWAIEKMTGRGRSDDREIDNILARLDWFETDVVPVLDYYRAHNFHNFFEINGERDIDTIHKEIVESLY